MASPRVQWDGRGYHRVASVQETWGLELLGRIPQARYRRILDAGCGSGRLTIHLMRRFPSAQVVCVDVSDEMLNQAVRTLSRFGPRLQVLCADLCELRLAEPVDLVFSNATLHWVEDHPRLYANLHGLLRPGGWLVAQCGGRGNLKRARLLASQMARQSRFLPYFARERKPFFFCSATMARSLLRSAGFCDVRSWTTPAPTRFPNGSAFREFARHVFLRWHLQRLPDHDLTEAFLDRYVRTYGRRFGRSYELDYVRLNITARRPQS